MDLVCEIGSILPYGISRAFLPTGYWLRFLQLDYQRGHIFYISLCTIELGLRLELTQATLEKSPKLK